MYVYVCVGVCVADWSHGSCTKQKYISTFTNLYIYIYIYIYIEENLWNVRIYFVGIKYMFYMDIISTNMYNLFTFHINVFTTSFI